jgi:hypothetical protein
MSCQPLPIREGLFLQIYNFPYLWQADSLPYFWQVNSLLDDK